ncbi:hypothetical protein ILUMI_14165 [Ignelater luminosus]|uniref:Uncharacterized protein n=1 Tax=Ignelater luminosus TaxID=2038154 RepID=A0A8K0CWG1_IGNLU|nr:hypothetical protein ILUMI_14165 [Ignelater luminosus]
MGRKATNIASALSKIIEEVLRDNPEVTELTMWSDSCVPQNKSSIMTFAMGRIIANSPELQKITMKYSTPSHSAVQEIDAVHSTIEGVLRNPEYYSPMGLLRIGKNKKYKSCK